jgi:penicillin-binding protein 1A
MPVVRGMLVRWMRRLGVLLVAAAALGVVGVALVLAHYERDLPSVEQLRTYRPPQVTRVLARDGSLLAELFIERRTVVPLAKVPKEVRIAVLAAEDADFYQHEGLDYLGMLRALVVNVRAGSFRQGGSTITQQVVKNVLLSPERTFERKAREVLLARRIEQRLEKDEILELYLNHIYFGHGRHGIEEACRYYFGKSVGEVTLAEAALLAGLVKGPQLYSPRVDLERSRKRRDAVLELVATHGFASRDLVESAKAEPIVLAPAVDALPELAPEAVEEVRRTLRELAGSEAARGGFVVHTTIDPELQASARRALRETLDAYADRHGLIGPFGDAAAGRGKRKRPPALAPFEGTPEARGHRIYHAVVLGADDAAGKLRVRVGTAEGTVALADARRYNPRGVLPTAFAPPGTVLRVSAVTERGVDESGVPHEFRLELGPQGAVVVLDVATRELLALVGSYEAVRGGLDRATFARRQPGSAFKPIVYSYGVHARRLTAATVVRPAPPAPLDGGTPLAGLATDPLGTALLVRRALAISDNDAAVWALRQLGPASVAAWGHALGIRGELGATDSLALGAYEVTPRELGAAYATFAAGGAYEDPVLVTRIQAPDGGLLALPPRPPRRPVLDAAEAYVVTSLLTSVVKEGTARRASTLGLPLAGKTGTSNRARDAWFAGYSPALVCVAWAGYDDDAPLGERESGATAALPAFIAVMKRAHEGRPAGAFAVPPGVTRVAVDPRTGLRAYDGQPDAVEEIFLEGTEPVEAAARPDAGAGGGAPLEPALAAAEENGSGPVEQPPGDSAAPSPAPPPARPEPPPF